MQFVLQPGPVDIGCVVGYFCRICRCGLVFCCFGFNSALAVAKTCGSFRLLSLSGVFARDNFSLVLLAAMICPAHSLVQAPIEDLQKGSKNVPH